MVLVLVMAAVQAVVVRAVIGRLAHHDPAAIVAARGGRTLPPGADHALWNALRTRRRELAQEQGVPPYVIFHDATLMAMMEARPHSLSTLAELPGVGQRKLNAYGEAFLEVIQRHT